MDDLDINNVQQSNINLCPKQILGTMHLSSNNTEITSLVLIYMLEQIVYDSEVDDYRYEINLSQIQPGIYFLQMHTTLGTTTERVQVTR